MAEKRLTEVEMVGGPLDGERRWYVEPGPPAVRFVMYKRVGNALTPTKYLYVRGAQGKMTYKPTGQNAKGKK